MPEPASYRQRLVGKTALVTGAGADGEEIGIGRAIAYLLAREGAAVMCADLDGKRAERTAAQISSEGGRAAARAADVSRQADCEALVEAAVAQFGRVDILVNNVGISTPVQLDTVTLDLWHRIIDTNLTSVMLMSKFAIPHMAAHGGGSIVNISSIAGMRAMGALAYGPSKAAMAQLSRELGVLHGRQGIRVNTVAPGHVMTPHAMKQLPAEMRETRRKVNPLGIEGDAWDVAQAVLFLAGDEARFVNGVHLAVDGGVEGLGPLAGHALVTGP
jgi:NAD(P)-dependent dehydrogenase (short-subunit alcohol dehydrogenase family)